MSKLKIGYENLLDNVSSYSFSAGSEDSDNPFANVYDNLLFDHMTLAASGTPYQIDITLDTSRTADYIGFYKTNLAAAGGTLKLQYWTGSAWADASSTITPTDTTPQFQTFTSRSSNQWKLIIDNNNTEVTISDIKFGEVMTTDYGVYIGFSVPSLAREVDYTVSDRGLPLGRSIRRKGFSTALNIEFTTDANMRSVWLPFIKHAERFPFYLAWNFTDYSSEIAYTVSDGPIGKPIHTHPGRQGVNMSISGFTE